jgi:gliding motility-associated-like protein
VNFTNLSSINGGNISYYDWNFGDGGSHSTLVNPQRCYNSGSYSVNLTAISDSGCVATTTLSNSITVYPRPVAGFNYQPSEPTVLEPLISITDNSYNATHWLYQFGDGDNAMLQNPQHIYAASDTQRFTVTQIVWNDYGCYDTSQKVVVIRPGYAIYIPNAFTPNADGVNEIFKAEGVGVKEFKMWIYDRWGNMIFHSTDLSEGWDGKVERGMSNDLVQRDVYVWKAYVKDVNEKAHSLMGSVTLIR